MINQTEKKIENIDLYNNKYDEITLVKNIDNLFVLSSIETQKYLSDEFIDKYILNEKYQKDRSDNITIYEILKHQPQYKEIKK